MATLTTDKRFGKVVGYNIQWCEGGRRCTIYLGSKRYARKTAASLKEIIDLLLYNRRNDLMPDRALENSLQNCSHEIRVKLAKAGLFIVREPKTCQVLWDAFLKFKAAEVTPKTICGYDGCRKHFHTMFLPTETIDKITPERLLYLPTAGGI